MRASRLLGQGGRLELRGRLPEARVALLRSLSLVDGEAGILDGAASSVRLTALRAVTRIASDMKDTQLVADLPAPVRGEDRCRVHDGTFMTPV